MINDILSLCGSARISGCNQISAPLCSNWTFLVRSESLLGKEYLDPLDSLPNRQKDFLKKFRQKDLVHSHFLGTIWFTHIPVLGWLYYLVKIFCCIIACYRSDTLWSCPQWYTTRYNFLFPKHNLVFFIPGRVCA